MLKLGVREGLKEKWKIRHVQGLLKTPPRLHRHIPQNHVKAKIKHVADEILHVAASYLESSMVKIPFLQKVLKMV